MIKVDNIIFEILGLELNEKVVEISRRFRLPLSLSYLLYQRGLIDEERIKKFLVPESFEFYNPFLLPNIKEGALKLIDYLKQGKNVLIYGDYDVDGITSIVVLKKGLENLGFYLDYYIPSRIEEGYGLNKEAISKLVNEKNIDLILTVDNGISSKEEVEYAKSLGIDIIITDHHNIDEKKLPKDTIVINPKLKESQYPYKEISGVIVAYKLLQVIYKLLNKEMKSNYLLEYVALGTLADYVPLLDENRKIVIEGIKQLKQTEEKSLKLIKEKFFGKNSYINRGGLEDIFISGNQIREIIFKIVPFLNAPGRISHASESVDLLLENNEEKLKEKFIEVKKVYNKRVSLQKKIYEKVKKELENLNIEEEKFIILNLDYGHIGINSSIASRLSEEYNIPVFIFSPVNDMYIGSGRSIEGFDIYNIMKKLSNSLEYFGGHSYAVGVRVKKNLFPIFKESLKNIIKDSLKNYDISISKIKVDYDLNIDEIDDRFYKIYKRFEPFGIGNRKPLFLSRNVLVEDEPKIVGERHLKLKIRNKKYYIDCIGFNKDFLLDKIKGKSIINIVYTIGENFYLDKYRLQLELLYVF